MPEDEGDVLEGEDEEKKKEDEDERVEQNDVGEQRSTLTQRCCGRPVCTHQDAGEQSTDADAAT